MNYDVTEYVLRVSKTKHYKNFVWQVLIHLFNLFENLIWRPDWSARPRSHRKRERRTASSIRSFGPENDKQLSWVVVMKFELTSRSLYKNRTMTEGCWIWEKQAMFANTLPNVMQLLFKSNFYLNFRAARDDLVFRAQIGIRLEREVAESSGKCLKKKTKRITKVKL